MDQGGRGRGRGRRGGRVGSLGEWITDGNAELKVAFVKLNEGDLTVEVEDRSVLPKHSTLDLADGEKLCDQL